LIGIFHPRLNACGGAEYVAINIIKKLKEEGYPIAVLTNEKIKYEKIKHFFNIDLIVDKEFVLSYNYNRYKLLAKFASYADLIRSLLLKLSCSLLIDTQSNSVFPWNDISYIHYPFLKTLNIKHNYEYIYHLPYTTLIKKIHDSEKQMVIANSEFTAKAIKETMNIEPILLYPPVNTSFFDIKIMEKKENDVVIISRFSKEKNLELIPEIVKNSKDLKFLLIGGIYDTDVLNYLLSSIKKNGLTNNLKILTNISRNQMRDILCNSKVYLHVTRSEGFGISIVEAMASGCIPIVYDYGGPTEFVPRNYRYQTLDEINELLHKTIDSWSVKKGDEMSLIAEKFNEDNFKNNFFNLFKEYI